MPQDNAENQRIPAEGITPTQASKDFKLRVAGRAVAAGFGIAAVDHTARAVMEQSYYFGAKALVAGALGAGLLKLSNKIK